MRLRLAIIVIILATIGFSTYTVLRIAGENRKDIERIQRTLRIEKVCSLSHQGEPCRDLFNRMAVNLSHQQRYRLACDVMAALKTPEAERMHRTAECPPPIPSPK